MNPAEFLREGFVEIREHFGRTVLQTLGVILGVASVVATLGMTASMDARRDQYFRESGGTLLVGVYNQPPAELELTARQRAMMGLKLEDAEAIRETVDGFDLVVAEINRTHIVRAGATEERFRVTAIEPEYKQFRELHMGSGRYITAHDMDTAAAVVVLGSTRARELFGTADPVGKLLNIDGKAYTVVGVTKEMIFHFQRSDSYNPHEWLNQGDHENDGKGALPIFYRKGIVLAQPFINVFHIDNGIIHKGPDGYGQPAKCHGVDIKAHKVENDQCSQQGYRNGQNRNDGCP